MCVPILMLYFIWGRELTVFFLEKPAELALNIGVVFLRILSTFYFVVLAKLVADWLGCSSGYVGSVLPSRRLDRKAVIQKSEMSDGKVFISCIATSNDPFHLRYR